MAQKDDLCHHFPDIVSDNRETGSGNLTLQTNFYSEGKIRFFKISFSGIILNSVTRKSANSVLLKIPFEVFPSEGGTAHSAFPFCVLQQVFDGGGDDAGDDGEGDDDGDVGEGDDGGGGDDPDFLLKFSPLRMGLTAHSAFSFCDLQQEEKSVKLLTPLNQQKMKSAERRRRREVSEEEKGRKS